MITFGPEIAETIAANCRKNAAAIAEAVTRTFGAECEMTAASVQDASTPVMIAALASPGLAGVLKVGPTAALIGLPGGGIVPEWCVSPDASGRSQLATMAQELAMLSLPEEVFADDCKMAWVEDVSDAVARGQVIGGARVALTLVAGGQESTLSIIWPAANPNAVLMPSAAEPPPSVIKPPPVQAPLPAAAAPSSSGDAFSIDRLPSYSRSLLKIRVAVTVALASKKQPIGRIIELGPGAIIHFDKSCEEMLDLEIGGQTIAQGEPVKVGDKFGIRLTSLTPPHERFVAVKRGR